MGDSDSLMYYYLDRLKYNRTSITINSTDRVDYANTTASDYTYYLKTPLFNVVAIKAVNMIVPNTQYVINSSNNKFDFIESLTPGITRTITIQPGTYTSTEISNAINLAMNTSLGVPFGTIFTCTYITYLQKMRIDRIDFPNTFNILWGTGPSIGTSIRSILGFPAVDTGLVSTTQSVQPIHLSGHDFIYLTIKDVGNMVNMPYKDTFAQVILNVPPKSISFSSFVSNSKIYKTPLTKLERFDVKFLNPDGSLYDFNSFDNSIFLEIYTLG